REARIRKRPRRGRGRRIHGCHGPYAELPAARVTLDRSAGERHAQIEGRPRRGTGVGAGAGGDRALRGAIALPPLACGAQHAHDRRPRTPPRRGAPGIQRDRRSVQTSVAELRRAGGRLHPGTGNRHPARRARDGRVAWRETPFPSPISIGRPLTKTAGADGRSLRRQPRGRGHHELAEQAVLLAERTSREKESVRRPGGRAVTESEGPQTIDRDGRAVGGMELALLPQLAVALETPGVQRV